MINNRHAASSSSFHTKQHSNNSNAIPSSSAITYTAPSSSESTYSRHNHPNALRHPSQPDIPTHNSQAPSATTLHQQQHHHNHLQQQQQLQQQPPKSNRNLLNNCNSTPQTSDQVSKQFIPAKRTNSSETLHGITAVTTPNKIAASSSAGGTGGAVSTMATVSASSSQAKFIDINHYQPHLQQQQQGLNKSSSSHNTAQPIIPSSVPAPQHHGGSRSLDQHQFKRMGAHLTPTSTTAATACASNKQPPFPNQPQAYSSTQISRENNPLRQIHPQQQQHLPNSQSTHLNSAPTNPNGLSIQQYLNANKPQIQQQHQQLQQSHYIAKQGPSRSNSHHEVRKPYLLFNSQSTTNTSNPAIASSSSTSVATVKVNSSQNLQHKSSHLNQQNQFSQQSKPHQQQQFTQFDENTDPIMQQYGIPHISPTNNERYHQNSKNNLPTFKRSATGKNRNDSGNNSSEPINNSSKQQQQQHYIQQKSNINQNQHSNKQSEQHLNNEKLQAQSSNSHSQLYHPHYQQELYSSNNHLHQQQQQQQHIFTVGTLDMSSLINNSINQRDISMIKPTNLQDISCFSRDQSMFLDPNVNARDLSINMREQPSFLATQQSRSNTIIPSHLKQHTVNSHNNNRYYSDQPQQQNQQKQLKKFNEHDEEELNQQKQQQKHVLHDDENGTHNHNRYKKSKSNSIASQIPAVIAVTQKQSQDQRILNRSQSFILENLSKDLSVNYSKVDELAQNLIEQERERNALLEAKLREQAAALDELTSSNESLLQSLDDARNEIKRLKHELSSQAKSNVIKLKALTDENAILKEKACLSSPVAEEIVNQLGNQGGNKISAQVNNNIISEVGTTAEQSVQLQQQLQNSRNFIAQIMRALDVQKESEILTNIATIRDKDVVKLVGCLTDMVLNFAPAGCFSESENAKPSIKQIWKWLKKVLQEYMVLKSAAGTSTLTTERDTILSQAMTCLRVEKPDEFLIKLEQIIGDFENASRLIALAKRTFNVSPSEWQSFEEIEAFFIDLINRETDSNMQSTQDDQQ